MTPIRTYTETMHVQPNPLAASGTPGHPDGPMTHDMEWAVYAESPSGLLATLSASSEYDPILHLRMDDGRWVGMLQLYDADPALKDRHVELTHQPLPPATLMCVLEDQPLSSLVDLTGILQNPHAPIDAIFRDEQSDALCIRLKSTPSLARD